ncbi:DUF488 domain-containing protein [Streptomyces stramineus]|uniref:DUF488 family protein n=1 Tax=Streptomyces stramineus TaxID=173861 RepID=A0ABP3JGC8_9ACTN
MSPAPPFRVRRVYDAADPADGVRVLVDRLWPRGLSKERAAVDEWLKDVTPSGELRSRYHRTGDHEEFAERYRAELAGPGPAAAARHLRDLARTSTVTLVTSVKDVEHSHVPVLVEHLRTLRA